MEVTELADHVAHFQERVLQDALANATADYWRRRADQFAAAMPRPGDFTGLPVRPPAGYAPGGGRSDTRPREPWPPRTGRPGLSAERLSLLCRVHASLMLGGDR